MRRKVPATERGVPGERGAVLALVAVSMLVLLGIAALVIDVGQMFWVRRDLQNAADAGALAAVRELSGDYVGEAQFYSEQNHPGYGQLVGASDVVPGTWDGSDFIPHGNPGAANAIQVTANRTQAYGNPVDLFFARIFGISNTDISATGVALITGGTTRFLIDDEMIDSDVDSIYNGLCGGNSTCSENLITDNGDGDLFIQLSNDYAGTELWLPTGQVGDEGMFDIAFDTDGCPFPFPDGNFSFVDFMLHNVQGLPNNPREIIPDEDLDPLVCVEQVNTLNYQSYVDPGFVHVSPVYKSDISDLNDVRGDPAINAKGERRGLIAFSIIGWRYPGQLPQSGSSSSLPDILIKIRPPQDITSLSPITGGGTKLVK